MVTGVDVNERAVLLANENAATLGVADRYAALTPDDVPGDATYDEIWSNPPIRIGKQALHDLLLTWFARLAPDGRAVMVVGKNLGADSLQRWLGEQGYPTERLASAKGFRVLESRPLASSRLRPRPASQSSRGCECQPVGRSSSTNSEYSGSAGKSLTRIRSDAGRPTSASVRPLAVDLSVCHAQRRPSVQSRARRAFSAGPGTAWPARVSSFAWTPSPTP